MMILLFIIYLQNFFGPLAYVQNCYAGSICSERSELLHCMVAVYFAGCAGIRKPTCILLQNPKPYLQNSSLAICTG